MFKKIYSLLHTLASKPNERSQYSGGYWQYRVRQKALDLCGDVKDKKILEVGCGEGLFLSELASKNPQGLFWGIDNNAQRLKKAEMRCIDKGVKNINLSVADAEKLPFSDKFFDLAICINVFFNMETIARVREALKEIKRVSKNNSRLIFDFRNSANILLKVKYKLAPYYDSTVKDLPLKTYNFKEIKRLLGELGFDVISKKYIGFGFGKFSPIIVIEAENKC
jgi:ubiquinone/menaquinone biosynthesis C-methylase UbiE